MKTTVVHCRKKKYDVYIGRPSIWGNPFSHKEGTLAEFKVATRKNAIEQFKTWFMGQPELVEKAKKELSGKILGCWCKPKSCHGDIIAEVVNKDQLELGI